jgi:hypothetical protein
MMWQSAPRRNGENYQKENWFGAGVDPVAAYAPGPSVETADQDEHAGLPLERLEAEICSLAGRLAMFTQQWLRLVAEFDRRKGWAQWGVKSCAHWLTWACSVAPGAAREYVRVSAALTTLPLLDEAFAQGRLSYSKVRAVTRVADRVDERTLLEQAQLHTAAQLERLVRGYRKADGAGLDQQRRRRARWFFDEDGMLVLTARLPSDEGALLVAALAQAGAGSGDTADLVEADALMMLAQNSLAADQPDSSGDERHMVVLHADARLLTGEDPGSPEQVCRIENGPGVDKPTAMRISCDAALVALMNSAVPGEQLRLGRKTRKISPALRRALRVRDGGCTFPGCHRLTHLEAHHIVHWLHGGATDLENLVLLCRRHHMAIHEEGFSVSRSNDPAHTHCRFHRPDGVVIPRHRELHPGPVWEEFPDWPGVPIDPASIRPGWRGERFSLADSVSVLCGASVPRDDELSTDEPTPTATP